MIKHVDELRTSLILAAEGAETEALLAWLREHNLTITSTRKRREIEPDNLPLPFEEINPDA